MKAKESLKSVGLALTAAATIHIADVGFRAEDSAIITYALELTDEEKSIRDIKKAVTQQIGEAAQFGNIEYLESEVRSKLYHRLILGKEEPKTEWHTGNRPKISPLITVHVEEEIATVITYQSAAIKDFLSKAFPKGWTNNLGSFEQKPTHNSMAKSHGINSESAATTISYREPGNPVSVFIKYDLVPVDISYGFAFNTITHEICHGNDWRSAQTIDRQKRYQLIVNILTRLKSANRFKSAYVEDINLKDTQDQNYKKTQEYFAVICSQWFEDATKLAQEDFDLITNWINLFDPYFSIEQFKLAKKNVIANGEKDELGSLLNTGSAIENKILMIEIEANQIKLKLIKLYAALKHIESDFMQINNNLSLTDEEKPKELKTLLDEYAKLDTQVKSYSAQLQNMAQQQAELISKLASKK